VKAFEEMFARKVGAKYAVATSSCTTALHLSLLTAGIGPGDKVICPSFSFIATANAIRYCGAEPVFGDIEPRTYNLAPEEVEALLKKEKGIKAILVVDQVGLPASWKEFNELAERCGVILIEDAACAIGSEYCFNGEWKRIGSFNDYCCFSLHGRKVLTTGEGGVITTSQEAVARRLRRLRHHGMSISDMERHEKGAVVAETYDEVGFNYRMSDIQAAVGIVQLGRLDELVQKRRKVAEAYTRSFSQHPSLVPPFVPAETKPNFQSYLLRLRDSACVSRDELMEKLLERGIHTRRGIMATHRESCYASFRRSLPVTERASDETLILPLYPAMTEEEVQYVVENVLDLMSG
jgi:dTDP-4-amino-4,6-dideoxygalactose transaminase